MTTRTQKTTKVSEAERLEALQDFKREIRRTDPNLSAQEVDRRARFAAGLSSFNDLQQESGITLDNLPESRSRRAARATAEATGAGAARLTSSLSKSSAQKIIFGIMLLTVSIQLFSDIIEGRNRQIDVIPRRIFAGSLAGIMLMMLAVLVPKIAVGLATLMALTTLLYQGRGLEVLDRLTARAGGTVATIGTGASNVK